MRTIKIIYNDMQKNEVVFSTHYLQSVRISNHSGACGECCICFDLTKTTETLARIPERVARNTYKELTDFLSDDYSSITLKLLRADGEEVTNIHIIKHYYYH